MQDEPLLRRDLERYRRLLARVVSPELAAIIEQMIDETEARIAELSRAPWLAS